MRKYVNSDKPLGTNHRNMLSVAYKNVVGALRSSWRVLSSRDEETTKAYAKVVQDELVSKCRSVIVSVLCTICTSL